MPAKLTLHPPQRASRFLVVRDGESLLIGRDPACGLVLEDTRVSKRHAQLSWNGHGWTLEDLDSKNGTTVNGEPARGAELRDGDRISFGGLTGRFEPLTAEAEPVDLLLRFLESAMQLTRTERGFMLMMSADGKLRAEVAAGLSPEAVRDERFRGSVGAVRQALVTGGPVVLSDVRADPALGKRPSVVSLGIGSLACVPLRHDGRILGVIYVDSRKLGPTFTQLDLDILENMADHMGAILAGTTPSRDARSTLAPEDALVAQLQQRIEELLPAI